MDAKIPDKFFRELSPEEEEEFRAWAREHFNALTEPEPVWHPCVRDEWARMLRESDVPQ